MMKRFAPLILLLACLSVVSGYLCSKMSWIGRFSVRHVRAYRGYDFLRTWWKGAAVMFFLLMALLALQGWLEKQYKGRRARIIHITALVLALAGLYFTYSDFQHNYAHRWMKERFHLGFYLFWVSWMIVSLFFLLAKKGPVEDGNTLPSGPETQP